MLLVADQEIAGRCGNGGLGRDPFAGAVVDEIEMYPGEALLIAEVGHGTAIQQGGGAVRSEPEDPEDAVPGLDVGRSQMRDLHGLDLIRANSDRMY